MPNQKIKIGGEGKGKRLDIFLAESFKEKSRSFWQKEIKKGSVLVNNEKSSVHRFLKDNDIVEIAPQQKKIYNLQPTTYNPIFECPDYLIVEKPAGVLTHTDGKEPGLADQLIRDFPEIKKVGEDGRWGVVHRLDRDASGLLVIARTNKFFEHIKKQFEEREIKKIYLALVYGVMPRDEDDLDFAIGRGEEKMAARPVGAEGREARTHFEVIKKFQNYTYIEAQILTGRTHQIRAHMLAYGHPIVGDKIYKLRKQKIKDLACGRLFLHSHILGFKDMKGEYVEYKSKLPKELSECLKPLCPPKFLHHPAKSGT